MTTAPRGGHAALVESLYERGLLDDTWRTVWHAVPRDPFIPPQAWRQGPQACVPLTDPAERLALIHSDEPVVIQLDDGRPDGPGIATSSNSQPSMVARMLRLLELADGHRVLEIGTASGYVAALLSRRLGDSRVYSVEVDPRLAQYAAAVLKAAGYAPHLACADGEWGWSAAAPFDRIVATCALRHVPYPLVQQVRPGGHLVAPLARDFWSGALVRLTVDDHGTASGRFHGGASYMPMRSHRPPAAAPVEGTARAGRADVAPRALLGLGFALYAGTRLPGVQMWHAEQPGGEIQVWAQDRAGSAATAVIHDVWQYGRRDLWREIEEVYREYHGLSSPAARDFGLTVTADGQQMWLRHPNEIVVPTPRLEEYV